MDESTNTTGRQVYHERYQQAGEQLLLNHIPKLFNTISNVIKKNTHIYC